MNLAFFMNLRDFDASEIGESRHTRHMEWAYSVLDEDIIKNLDQPAWSSREPDFFLFFQ